MNESPGMIERHGSWIANGQQSRLIRAVRDEIAHLSPSLVLAQAAISLLPPYTGNRLRVRILRAAGFHIGHGTVILGPVRFTAARNPASHVTFGKNDVVNFGCLFEAAAEITIGDDVGIGQEVMVLTNRHKMGNPGRRLGPLEALPVRVEDGAWLSTRAVVVPGVTIGEGAVVAAGAVVTRSVAPHTVVGGVPAQRIRELPT